MALVEVDAAGGRLGSSAQDLAVQALREEGVVVLRDAVDPRHIEILRERMLEDLERYLARPDAPFNWNRGNVQQDPPPLEPYLFRDILANDAAIGVTHEILGNGMYNAFYSGNTAIKSESRQPVHADTGQLWPNLATAHPPVQIVVNVAMVDFSPKNGSTEIWPGTHLDPTVAIQSGDIEVPAARLKERRKVSPPVQPVVSAGSLILRDIRLWHAGMPNRTETPRPMIAMIHSVSWWPSGRLRFPRAVAGRFDHPQLETRADYLEEAFDYISVPGAYAFSAETDAGSAQ